MKINSLKHENKLLCEEINRLRKQYAAPIDTGEVEQGFLCAVYRKTILLEDVTELFIAGFNFGRTVSEENWISLFNDSREATSSNWIATLGDAPTGVMAFGDTPSSAILSLSSEMRVEDHATEFLRRMLKCCTTSEADAEINKACIMLLDLIEERRNNG